ncbi:M48 family metallopeptidase [Bradyrhizobium sp. JYMT SZCCT0428]|nr:M48 family metallopeptidase [Bradyrhizobium sp. JYMT SZCCT0428]
MALVAVRHPDRRRAPGIGIATQPADRPVLEGGRLDRRARSGFLGLPRSCHGTGCQHERRGNWRVLQVAGIFSEHPVAGVCWPRLPGVRTGAQRRDPRCATLDENTPGRRGVAAIVGWSLAATVSIIAVVLFGVPLAADRLAPLVPEAFERRLGEAAESQVKTIFDAKVCDNAAGQKAFVKLMTAIRESAGMDTAVQSSVLSSSVPNAFALPGGRVYMFNGLLAKAENADEIAGVLAHELGHHKHRDNMRGLIRDGGTAFLVGLLFGDITGSGALIFASKTLVTSSHSREAEQDADGFSIDVMHRLGRPTKPMGELLVRVTGKGGKGLSIISSHPMSEDRLARMTREDRPASKPPLLTPEEWQALKSICDSDGKI